MAQLLYANQFFLTTLNVGGGITDSQTTGIILSDVSGIDTTKPGIVLLSYADPLVTTTCEWAEYTSINGSKELVGVTRGSEGFSAKAHDNGVNVAFPLSESHINRLADALSIGGSATNAITGTLDEDNMASNSATKLATQQSIKAYVDAAVTASSTDGWTSSSDTFTYASANSFTIAGVDRTTIYKKGTRIKLTQTTAKYFYVTASAFATDTTVTITAGTDYTLANAAITSPYYSYVVSPQSFPYTFTCAAPVFDTATIDSGTGGVQPTVGTSKFSIIGNTVNYIMQLSTANAIKNGASALVNYTLPLTLPDIVGSTLETVGPAYSGNITSLMGVSVVDDANEVYMLFQSSVADNASLASGGANITYRY